MQECKRLFRRDKVFLLCLSGGVALILLFGLLIAWKWVNGLEEMRQFHKEIYGEAVGEEIFTALLDSGFMEMVHNVCVSMMKYAFGTVILAQIIKWSVLEGKGGKEFQNLLPIKSSVYVTYDYICGILFLWMPVIIEGIALSAIFANTIGITYVGENVNGILEDVMRELILVSFLYSLLIFSKKITRYIPGIFLIALVGWYMGPMLLIWCTGESDGLFWNWEWYDTAGRSECLLMLLCVPVLVALSYWCDKKRDIAGNGLFYFKSVHFLMMAIIFVEFFCIFAISGIIPQGMASNTIGVLLAGAVTAGIHYLTWGRTGSPFAFDGKREGKE